MLGQFEQAPLTRLAPDADDYILAQILEIGAPRQVRVMDRTERLAVTISDLAASAPSIRELVLWDDQKLLAAMLRRVRHL